MLTLLSQVAHSLENIVIGLVVGAVDRANAEGCILAFVGIAVIAVAAPSADLFPAFANLIGLMPVTTNVCAIEEERCVDMKAPVPDLLNRPDVSRFMLEDRFMLTCSNQRLQVRVDAQCVGMDQHCPGSADRLGPLWCANNGIALF